MEEKLIESPDNMLKKQYILMRPLNTILLILTVILLSSFNLVKFDLTPNMNYLATGNINLPDSKNPLVIRTYFKNNNDEWKSISNKLIANYEMGFRAYVDLLDDKKYQDIGVQEILNNGFTNYKHNFLFLADSITFANPENSVLCIDLSEEVGRVFRVIPSELWGVENNLSIGNMYYQEFFENCDEDGVFRGFK